MAAQAALIADTIVGMKRALRKENDNSGPDDPIMQPTNRGNKLQANAKHVREGALGYIHPEELYKQKIHHAGYTRYILQPNPIRYDSEGDELDEDDEHSEADVAAAEENPFSEIALEHFLCPLKHPSELPVHPSMSNAYTSNALLNMTQAIEAKLRQERALLWRAKNLHKQFLGDGPWMPCGAVESPEDRWIFEPRPFKTRNTTPMSYHDSNGVALEDEGSYAPRNKVQDTNTAVRSTKESLIQNPEAQPIEKDVEMTDSHSKENHESKNSDQARTPKAEEIDTPVGELPQHPENFDSGAQPNGGQPADQDRMSDPEETIDKGGKEEDNTNDDRKTDNRDTRAGPEPHNDVQGHDTDVDTEMQYGSHPEPPRRMTTRAQTNAGNSQENDDDLSPSPSSDTLSTLPTPHPLFLVPDSVRPDPNFGLPPNEAEDTRRLLWSYVQKQEETVRGFEHMLENLLRASRMKEDVFEWCKAEGHVGEMSDGEDWYDREKWGLAQGEDLKKGADEDEIETVEESRTSNKRGRGRRA